MLICPHCRNSSISPWQVLFTMSLAGVASCQICASKILIRKSRLKNILSILPLALVYPAAEHFLRPPIEYGVLLLFASAIASCAVFVALVELEEARSTVIVNAVSESVIGSKE